MQRNKEISALFNLIDDPDEEVFGAVSDRIINYGKEIIPNLEDLWENTISEEVQSRIEMLIHKLHYTDLVQEFKNWKNSIHPDLFTGALLVARYRYPELQKDEILADIEKLRKYIWLELNNFLTPLEQINVISSIIFHYYNLKGTEINYYYPDHFLINKQLENKKGNAIANEILYLIISEQLDIPVKAINIPNQFIMSYFKTDIDFMNDETVTYSTGFFIDPLTGQIFTQRDLDSYLERMQIQPNGAFYIPKDNLTLIRILLEEFSLCYNNEEDKYKRDELMQLAEILREKS